MIATLKDVVQRLVDLGIDYMVTGSFAMSVYATARTTMDIDVILVITGSDAERFERKFIGDYYVSAASIRRADENQSMFNILSNLNGVKVDCIVRKGNSFEVEKFRRRKRSKIGDLEFWVIGKEDLILSKLDWAKNSLSELQFRDVRNLCESGVDVDFLSVKIDQLGLNETWKEFERWKIQAAK